MNIGYAHGCAKILLGLGDSHAIYVYALIVLDHYQEEDLVIGKDILHHSDDLMSITCGRYWWFHWIKPEASDITPTRKETINRCNRCHSSA